MEEYEELKKLIPDSKRPRADATSHEMAEVLGWNDCVFEMNIKLADILLKLNPEVGKES